MRPNLVLLLLVGSLTTLACNKEETANPDDVKPETTEEPAPTEDPAATEEPAAADPELTAVCQHMMDLMIADLGDTMEMTPEAQEEAKAACAIDLASKRAENPEEFATKLECITAATNLEQSVACG
jgi:hypothetical protein